MISLSVGIVMTTIDSSIVNIALPEIGRSFQASLTAVQWVAVAYVVAVTAFLPTAGRLSDMGGRKRPYVTGFAVFTVASALCALAPSLAVLVCARILQAVGGALMFANDMAIIIAAFPPQERGRAMGLVGAVVSVGLTLGPTLGGMLVGWVGWHAIFTINLPIGVAGVFLALRVLKNDTLRDRSQRFDLAGAALLLIALVSLTVGLNEGSYWGWSSPATLALLGAALISGAAFWRVESCVSQPAVDLALLHNRVFAFGNASLFLAFLATFTSVLLAPFFIQDLLGLPPQYAGLLMTVVPLVQFVVSPIAGLLSDRLGARWLAAAGLALASVGFVLMSRLNATSSVPEIVWRTAIMGLGFGLFQAPNSAALLGAAPPHRLGIASGLLALMRNLGMSIGLATAGAVFASRQALYVSQGVSAPMAFTGGFRDAHVLAAAVCVVSLTATLLQGAGVPSTSFVPTEAPEGLPKA